MANNALEGAFPERGVDTLPLRSASPECIDREKVVAHIAEARKRGRYMGPDDPEEYLATHNCIAELDGMHRATLVGLLCFGRDPQRFAQQAVIDIGHYRGTESVSFDVIHIEKNIGGTIFDQLQRAEEYLWRNTHHGMTLPERGLRRVEIHEYPLAVIRELLVNLLAHRDYTLIGSASRISLFRNRIEWISPGGLPPGVTIDNLLTAQSSRNPMLLKILYEAGFVEAYGQGLDTVVGVLKSEEMLPPTFRDIVSAFIVTVFGRTLQSEAHPESLVEVTTNQHRIVALIRAHGSLTPRDLREQLPDLSPRSVQRDIKALVDAGLVEPDGKSVAVQYRLREADDRVE
jgi:predicted HTH transcriptional regulator